MPARGTGAFPASTPSRRALRLLPGLLVIALLFPPVAVADSIDYRFATLQNVQGATWTGGALLAVHPGESHVEVVQYESTTDSFRIQASLPDIGGMSTYSIQSTSWDGANWWLTVAMEATSSACPTAAVSSCLRLLTYRAADHTAILRAASIDAPVGKLATVWLGGSYPDIGCQSGCLLVFASDSMFRYDAPTDAFVPMTWSTAQGTDASLADARPAVLGGVVYFFSDGGARVRKYTPETNTLAAVSATLPHEKSGLSVLAAGTGIYLFGGVDDDFGCSNEIVFFDPQTNAVEIRNATAPVRAKDWITAWDGSMAWLLGGQLGCSPAPGCSRCEENRYLYGYDPRNTLPTPRIEVSRSYGNPDTQFSLDGRPSFDLDGNIMSYVWDFGDGKSGNAVTTSHSYAAPGNYTVRLTVRDNEGAAATTTTLLQVLAPGSEPPPQPGPSSNPSPSSGSSGSSPSPSPEGGSVHNKAPTAMFGYTTSPLTINVEAWDSVDPNGDPLTFAWTFGDGASGTGPRTSHRFETPGTYDVWLIIRDNYGEESSSHKNVDIFAPRGPTAGLTANRTETVAGEGVLFFSARSYAGDNPIVRFEWDLGNGTYVVGASVAARLFPDLGETVVRLRVWDAGGLYDEDEVTITVKERRAEVKEAQNSLASYAAPLVVIILACLSAALRRRREIN